MPRAVRWSTVFLNPNRLNTKRWPNKSLQPTPVGAGISAFAGHVIDPAWLSFCRSPAGDFSARRGKSRCALASGHEGRLVHRALVSGVFIPGVCPREPTERIAGVQKRREQDHPEDLIALVHFFAPSNRSVAHGTDEVE
jgi:hypothetical protein